MKRYLSQCFADSRRYTYTVRLDKTVIDDISFDGNAVATALLSIKTSCADKYMSWPQTVKLLKSHFTRYGDF